MKSHVLCSLAAAATIAVYGLCVSGGVLPSLAGPPMICQPFEVDTTITIPGTPEGIKAYDRKNLVKETLAQLSSSTPVISRMETIRRASVLAAFDTTLCKELLTPLMARALDAEAAGKLASLSWFDAGYCAATLSQHSVQLGFSAGELSGCDGYLWIKKAMDPTKPDAGMEFAAALATHPAMHKGTQEIYEKHLRQAAGLAEKGSMVEKNIVAHATNWSVDLKSKASKEVPKK